VLPRDQRGFENYIKERKAKKSQNELLHFKTSFSEPKEAPSQQEPIFIVKPEAACQGKGIFLAKDMRDIELYSQN